MSEQLRRVAGLERAVTVAEVPGAADGLGWRTRIRFGVDRSGRIGLRRHRTHDLEPVGHCPVAAPGIDALGLGERTWPAGAELEAATTPDGAQRLVAVHTPGRRGKVGPNAVDGGVVVDGRVRREPGALEVAVSGRRFRVGAGSFWQVHVGAPEILGQAVLSAGAPMPGESAVDLFAGVGLFSALLATAVGPDGRVLAVERDRGSCADAVHNTADLPWVGVHRAAVTPALVGRLDRPDLVVLDPPRQGAGRQVMAALAALRPAPRLVYVACDAAAFARDLRILLDAGWALDRLESFDLFPMTEHVELVAAVSPPVPPGRAR